METVIEGTRSLDEPWVLAEPTTLRGGAGACIEGHARDALIRVRAKVTIENLEIRRVTRPDGAASWGSLVVVEPGGELRVSGCRLVGAAHGYIVERTTTLAAGESWVHAGIDVRGTGRAVVEKCNFEKCCLGAAASVYPRTDHVNLEVEGCRFTGCDGAVKVVAEAQASARKSVATGPGASAYQADGGELLLDRCDASAYDTGLLGNGGKLRAKGGCISGSRLGVRADRDAAVSVNGITISGSTGAAAAALGLSTLELRDTSVSAAGGNGLEVQGVASLRARGGSVEAPVATLLALDAGCLTVTGVSLGGNPEWAAYADVAGRIDVGDVPLPPGKVEARGCAQAARERGPGLDADAWFEVLRARADWPAPQRKAAARHWRGADEALVAAWVEAGAAGVGAYAAFQGKPPTAPVTLGAPATLAKLGRAAVSAILGVEGGCLVACTDGTLARVGSEGVEAKGKTSVGCVGLVSCPSHVAALSRGGTHSVHGLSLHDATLARVADTATAAPLVAFRLGNPHVLISVDDSGHPTDRCTWRHEWRPPAPMATPEAIAQGDCLPDERWDWTGPSWIRLDSFTTSLGAYTVSASDGQLRVHDGSGQCLVHLPLPGVSALGASPDRGTLYAGTTRGEVLALAVTLVS